VHEVFDALKGSGAQVGTVQILEDHVVEDEQLVQRAGEGFGSAPVDGDALALEGAGQGRAAARLDQEDVRRCAHRDAHLAKVVAGRRIVGHEQRRFQTMAAATGELGR
jgi:hypothetical protein